jgi:hypothetical protein
VQSLAVSPRSATHVYRADSLLGRCSPVKHVYTDALPGVGFESSEGANGDGSRVRLREYHRLRLVKDLAAR